MIKRFDPESQKKDSSNKKAEDFGKNVLAMISIYKQGKGVVEMPEIKINPNYLIEGLGLPTGMFSIAGGEKTNIS